MKTNNIELLNVPSFICIGAQRSGSTWLHHNLARHPQIFLPPKKEIHYFDKFDNTLQGYDAERVHQEKSLFRYSVFRLIIRSFFLALTNKRNLLEDMSFWRNYVKTDVSLDWYKSLFSKAASNGKTTGDITPAYSIDLLHESCDR